MKYQAVVAALRKAGNQASDSYGFKVDSIGSYCTVRYGRHFIDDRTKIQTYKQVLEAAGYRCSFDNASAPDVLFVYDNAVL